MDNGGNYDVSVVVPVYNTEKYLERGLESLVKQTIFGCMEVILIDDGSTDQSNGICREFTKRYSNIVLLEQNNQGVSAARNTGLNYAHGKYIGFFDSDDLVAMNMYEQLFRLASENDADIVIGDFMRVYPDGTRKKYRKNTSVRYYKQTELLKSFFGGTGIGNNVFDKLFKRELASSILFPVGFSIGEDMFYVYSAICNAEVVVADSSICGYQYMLRTESAMNNRFSDKYFDTITLSEKMLDDFAADSELRFYAKAHLVHEQCKVVEYMYKNNAGKEYDEQRKLLLQELKNYRALSGWKYLSKKQFAGYFLMRFSPGLYMLAHKIMKIG